MKHTLVLFLLFLYGCATQPHRARQLSNDFQQLPPEVQQRVMRGEIEIGDNAHAVYFALGTPNSIEILDPTGTPHPQWEYIGVRKLVELPNGKMVERFEPSTDMIFPSPFAREEHVRLLVTFKNDRVSDITLSENPKKRREEPLPLQAFLPDSPR